MLFLGENEEKVDCPLFTFANRLDHGLFNMLLLLFTKIILELVEDESCREGRVIFVVLLFVLFNSSLHVLEPDAIVWLFKLFIFSELLFSFFCKTCSSQLEIVLLAVFCCKTLAEAN